MGLPPVTSSPAAETRAHLLEAAAAVFAETGYRATTVRDICRRAGANGAAVNYHFGGKEELYAEVLRHSFRRALARFPADGGVSSGGSRAERLRGFVRAFLLRIFSDGPDSYHGKLIAREMVEPTAALDRLIDTDIRGLAGRLEGIIREFVGPDADVQTVRRCMASVVSQIVFYQHCRPAIRRLLPELRFEAPDLEALAEHIWRFALAGLDGTSRRVNRRGGRSKKPR